MFGEFGLLELWIALAGVAIGILALRIGVAYVAYIVPLLGAQTDLAAGEIVADEVVASQVYLPDAMLFFLVSGNAWLILSRSASDGAAAVSVLFVVLLWLLAYIDAHTTILPDVLTGLLAISGLVVRWSGLRGRWDDLGAYFAMGLGFGVPWLINWLYRRLRRADSDAIGQGDAKLLAGMGVWLGLQPLGTVIMSAAWLSVLYTLCKGLKKRRLPLAVPLGPFLALAGNIWILKHV